MSITSNEQTASLQWVDAMEWRYPDVAPGVDSGAGGLQALRGGCVAVQVAVRGGPDAAGEVRLRWGGYERDCAWPAPDHGADRLPVRLPDRASSPACALPGAGSGGREAHTKGNLT
jgi:hypothetical protein